MPRGGPVPITYLTNILGITNPAVPAVTAAPGVKLPTVQDLLVRMKEWREGNPVYHMLVETTGPDVSSTTEVFTYKREDGHPVSHIQSQVYQPIPLSFLLFVASNRVDAYFPQANVVAPMASAADQTNALQQLGWVQGPGFDPLNMFKSAKASFVEAGAGYDALTFVFPGEAFRMPVGAGDLFLTIKVDPAGKTLAVEQLTLGARLVSKMTYFADDPAKVAATAPRIPANAQRSDKSFQKLLEEESNLLKKKPTRTI